MIETPANKRAAGASAHGRGEETIVAVSSPPGRSARGLVRLSGPATRVILKDLLESPPASDRTLTPCRCRVGASGSLPCLVVTFAGPRSYTGEDMAELQCPGNPALLERVLGEAISRGARSAEPGEFTFRAFLAGKLDLTQAEGVAATIAATSEAQLQAAGHLLHGELGRFASDLVDGIATQLALVEAGIDFVDQDDVVPISPGELLVNLQVLRGRVVELLSRSRAWASVEALPHVVLVGPPSSGKSTLFNALLGRERAVMSPTPGTTRDVLAEPLRLRDPRGREIEVMLVDLAGLDTPAALLDEQVQAVARRAIAEADLVLQVADERGDTTPLPPTNATVLRVRTKVDLSPAREDTLGVSALSGRGVAELRRAIAERVGARGVALAADVMTLQPRHECGLRAAVMSLTAATDRLAPQSEHHAIEQVELIAGDLRQALDELAALGGQMTPDDVIGKVFATFCIGK